MFQLLKDKVAFVHGYERDKACVIIWNLVTDANNISVQMVEICSNGITGMLLSYIWSIGTADDGCFGFLLNNQPDALIIQILFCYKTLHVSGIFSAHHQVFSTVHSAVVSFMQVSDDRFQAEWGWNCSSILTLLGYDHQKPAWNLPVPNVQ